jgi:exopolyphosphatase/guanosine-5'-triphosphate,3'-diphosphate pyrophosphatase
MRLGVLDIGSNTVHLLLVDAHPGARPVPFASHKRPLSLVQYLEPDGSISDAGQHELTEFVLEAWEFAARHKAEDLLAFCTSAIREATNGPEVLARVKHETTVTLQELTGSEEASMTFFAVRRWHGWGAGPILNLDIGGGSFEMAFGQDELPEVATSVPLGASRLTRDWLAEDPPSAKSVKEVRRYIRATLKPAVRNSTDWAGQTSWREPPRPSGPLRGSPEPPPVRPALTLSASCTAPTSGCGRSASQP